jgi:hypothetical protein
MMATARSLFANSLHLYDTTALKNVNDFNWLVLSVPMFVRPHTVVVPGVFKYGILKDGILKVGKLVAKT